MLFQSTPPHGGRLTFALASRHLLLFQSTPPHGGRLVDDEQLILGNVFSIHAPRTGGDTTWRTPCLPSERFNPRPRTGGDRRGQGAHGRASVSIHAPHGGRHGHRQRPGGPGCRFNPRPRTGGD